jgi:hypothetical protein
MLHHVVWSCGWQAHHSMRAIITLCSPYAKCVGSLVNIESTNGYQSGKIC